MALFEFVRNGFRFPIAHENHSKISRLELDPADVRTDDRVDAANAIMIELIGEALSLCRACGESGDDSGDQGKAGNDAMHEGDWIDEKSGRNKEAGNEERL